ncbi:MAG: GNAT family N-acetyltransferase [Bacilli bacterium]
MNTDSTRSGQNEQGNIDFFLRITRHRMADHYLTKLLQVIRAVNSEQLWLHDAGDANSTGGVVLHICEHVRRSANLFRKTEKLMYPNGIEDHFPDLAMSPDELAATVETVFREWREAMHALTATVCTEDDMHHLLHLVEHTGYHLGQVVDRVQRMTGAHFQFCQNGLNERNLRLLIDGQRTGDRTAMRTVGGGGSGDGLTAIDYQASETGALASPDLERLCALHDTIFRSQSSATIAMELQKKHHFLILLALHEKSVVGFKIGYEDRTGRFYSWLGGVDPDFRGRGIASELMGRQHAWCIDNNYRVIRTHTKNKWRNMLILNLRHGFDIVGTFTDERGETKIILDTRL